MTAPRTKFYLDKRNRKLSGVCSGLADYTGLDPLVIRLAMVVATLITGPVMVLLYLVTGWLAADR